MRDGDERGTLSARPFARGGRDILVGRLLEHGAAKYWFQADQAASYYLKLLTDRGAKYVWGKDLDRALRESRTEVQVGDRVGVRRVSRETVTVKARVSVAPDAAFESKIAHRTRWEVEKITHFAERARLARQLREDQADVRATVRAHPELKSAFLSVRAAEEFAAERIRDPKDRERFLSLVKESIAGSIRKGEPLPAVKLRDNTRAATPRPPEKKSNEPTR